MCATGLGESVSGHSETTHETPHGLQESAAKNKLQHENTRSKNNLGHAEVKNRKRFRRQPKLPTAGRPDPAASLLYIDIDASPYNGETGLQNPKCSKIIQVHTPSPSQSPCTRHTGTMHKLHKPRKPPRNTPSLASHIQDQKKKIQRIKNTVDKERGGRLQSLT